MIGLTAILETQRQEKNVLMWRDEQGLKERDKQQERDPEGREAGR